MPYSNGLTNHKHGAGIEAAEEDGEIKDEEPQSPKADEK